MMFLLGRQAMLWHEPPMYLRSISATRFPCSAVVQAATLDPVPLPSTTRSYSSVFGTGAEGTLSISISFLRLTRSKYVLSHAHNPKIYLPIRYLSTRRIAQYGLLWSSRLCGRDSRRTIAAEVASWTRWAACASCGFLFSFAGIFD